MAAETARKPTNALFTWIPFTATLTALISFAVSMYTFVLTTRTPSVEVILPQRIRLAQGEESGYAYGYFQPTFVHSGPSQQAEVIRAMRLELTPAGGGETLAFEWRESGRLDYDPATGQSTYVYEGDATPLLLTRETAQSPLGVFYGPPGMLLMLGTWRGLLVAERTLNQTSLRAAFTLTLDEESIARLNESNGSVYLGFPITPAP